MSHDWDEPDRLGFDKILVAPLLQIDDLVILDTGHIDEKEVRQYATKYGSVEAQKYFNHIHLLPHCSDITIQRAWAYELIDSFRKKAAKCFPSFFVVGQIQDDGFDTEVTFWTVKTE
jgi:hypothetical protein